MLGTSIKSRRSVSRKKEYIVIYYRLSDDSFVCKTRDDDLMTLRQAERQALSHTLDGLYGVPTKVGE